MSTQDQLQPPGSQAIKPTKPRIFRIQQSELIEMFDRGAQRNARLTKLRELGYAQNILIGINSEAATGIVGDRGDLERRKAVYGENLKPLPPPSSIVDSFKQEVRNLLWVVIGATAIIAGLCGIYAKGWAAILEAIFLLAFALLMILLNAFIDYFKDKRFITLQSILIDESITVTRGKFGATEQISVWDLVVGDIVMVKAGQRVPGDALVLEASDFQVDENVDEKFKLQKDEEGNAKHVDVQLDFVTKGPYFNESSLNDPFIRADSLVTNGTGKLLICCTGERSSRGKVARKLEDDSVNTRLQTKLKNLGSQFTNYSLIACFIIFVILITMGVVSSTTGSKSVKASESQSVAGRLFKSLPENVNLFVVLVVVAIPEGLPLTIQISLAFSVMRMFKQDRILLRKQDALEKIAEANEFVIGKTNILTTGKMKVKCFHLEGITKQNNRPDTFLNCELQQNTIKLVQENILYNNTAYVQMGESKFVPVGDGTDVGLLKFLQNADIPIQTEINRRFDVNRVIANVPLRTSSAGLFYTACAVDEGDGFINVHIKGAPQAVLPLAEYVCGDAGQLLPLEQQAKGDFLDEVDKMAETPLRVIAFAHAEIEKTNWDQMVAMRRENTLNEVLSSLLVPNAGLGIKIVGALGLEDKIRPKAKSALHHAMGPVEDPRITVRMLTGDTLATARAVALQVGLVTEAQVLEAKSGRHQNVIMDAQTFDTATRNGEDEAEVRNILQHLRVLAKATPRHRLKVIEGLQRGVADASDARKVAVTGGAISDVEALNRATVALAMGSGCPAAKEVSDLVLTGDDFEATLRAVMWGRNIYHNVSRFLQFQVTVNLSCLLVVFVAPMYLGESPFSAVQLLWLNLVMDSLAAFALGTEPPLPNVASGKPYADQQVMRPQVWRQILGVSLWNFLVILCVLVFAPMTMHGLDYLMADSAGRGIETPEEAAGKHKELKFDDSQKVEDLKQLTRCGNKLRHCTYMFHIFVFLQLFNLINCRKDGATDYNVFGKFFHNWYFIIIISVELAFQLFAPGPFMRTASMNEREWGACLMVGSTALVAALLLKCTPLRWLNKLSGGPCGIVDETKAMNNKLTQGFDKVNSMQVGGEADDSHKDDNYDKMKVDTKS